MLIGIFVFYSYLLPLYNLDIRPWRHIFSNQPQLGTLPKNEDMEIMHNTKDYWNG